ncbi:MAG: glycosyltransferase family 4 protein [Balneolaceae bacterium]
MKDKPLILIGPKTGIQGGGTVSFNHLLDELGRREVAYHCIDMPGGNYTFLRALYVLKYIFIFFKTIRRESVISLHASENSALVYTLILDIFCRFTNSRLIVRVFGGHHLDYLSRRNRFLRRRVVQSYRRHTLLLQTQGMLQRARKEFKISNVAWFPTSRPSVKPKNRETFNTRDTLQLLYLGQIRPEKGIDDLINLAKEIEKHALEIRISIYGQVMDDDLMKQVQAQNPKVIEYCGMLDPEEVYDVIKKSDMILIPSKFKREGYPGALIEALNVHVPFIATGHHLYIRELVTEGKEGYFYDMDHPEQLWEIVSNINNNRNRLLELHDHIASRKITFTSDYWNGEYFLKLVERLRTEIEGTEGLRD